MELLTPMLVPEFRKAGWFPGRKVAVNFAVPEGHPAFPILAAFANLTVGHNGSGEECAISDIAFGRTPCPDEDIKAWEAALDTQLVCLGDCSSSHGQIWLDRTGRLFSNSFIHPMMVFVGDSFAAGVETLLQGRRSRPMLLPGQEKVMVGGEWFHAGDPRVLTPHSFHDT